MLEYGLCQIHAEKLWPKAPHRSFLRGADRCSSVVGNPITDQGTHRPANRPAGACPGGAALTVITSPLGTGYVACLRATDTERT
ncbi:hypothetical protein GCM10029963_48580 [Micromonospora andamanensis]|nr:hypothetical protein Vwe01_45760 [Micromonospora andamanensis]